MNNRSKARGAIVVIALVAAACGGDAATTDPTDTTSPDTQTTAPAGTDTTTTAPTSSGGDESSVTVTVDGTTYELKAHDVTGGITRCEPDHFGTGQFWVLARAVDEDGNVGDPQVDLNLSLYPMGEGEGEDLEFELTYQMTDDSSEKLNYVIATHPSVVSQAGEFDGDLGSWTIEGNRISGEVAVYEYDHIREYFTASFDITCPAE